jgi:RHS repeat-associated protein
MGTPEAMYREDGEAVWTCELNSYGRVRNFQGESKTMCPFRYQGQYEDAETGLYYNRFRYYDPSTGVYLSKDPIGLQGGMQLYGYVKDVNSGIDILGLSESVYQLVKDGKVVYYGITSRDAVERMAEHARIKDFDSMEILAEGLSHDQARSIEGALIRQRMAENVDKFSATDSIEKQLEKSGLLNKNRGRTKEGWTSDNPLDEFADKMHKKPKKVSCH